MYVYTHTLLNTLLDNRQYIGKSLVTVYLNH